MESIKTAQRRAPNEGYESSSEESPTKEVVEEDNETTKVIKMLVKVGGKPKVEILMYEGSLNAEERTDWIRSLD